MPAPSSQPTIPTAPLTTSLRDALRAIVGEKGFIEDEHGKPVLMRLPEIDFVDDKTGKPVGINEHIGRRPVAAFCNSDGDREMLE